MNRLLIDGTPISRHKDGLSQYILNVVARLDVSAYQCTLLVRPKECPAEYIDVFEHKGITVEQVPIAPIGPKRDIQFARYLRTHAPFDIAFIPSNQFPVALNIPAVYTVHDLIYEQFPEQLGRMSSLKRWYLHFVVGVGLRKAKRIIAISEYTKQEILRCHGEQYADKIQVVYEGWEHLLTTPSSDDAAPKGVHFGDYLLYVGSSRGHKNLGRLVEAVERCKDQLPSHFGVVIVGNTAMFRPEQLQAIARVNAGREVIQLTGWVEDADLTNYFRHAKALIFPSLSEGFGIPVLEAYYYRIPLLLSNQASLPEVAGDAAIYFNPYSAEDIADTIVQFIRQPDHIALIERQTQRLSMYSWDKTAREINQLLLSIHS